MTDTHSLQWFAMSTRGPVRDVNEDSVQFHPDAYMLAESPGFMPPEGQLCVVADGMGGLRGGKQASNMAVKIIIRSYYTQQGIPPQQAILESIQEAHHSIIQVMRQDTELERMGTTVVLAANRGQQTWIANVGDSRAYLWRNKRLTILSEDDRWVTAQVREQLLTEEQARHHEYRNLLNQHLGSEKEIVPHLQSLQLQPGDRLLLCTDGLFDFVSDQEISRILAYAPDKAVRRLLKLALEHSSNDNITVAVGHYRPVQKYFSTVIGGLIAKIGLMLLALIIVIVTIVLLFPTLIRRSYSDTRAADTRLDNGQQVAALAREDFLLWENNARSSNDAKRIYDQSAGHLLCITPADSCSQKVA